MALPSAVSSPAIRRRALPFFARIACHHGELALALEAYEELLAAQRLSGDRYGAAHTLIELANLHSIRIAYTDAWACLDASRKEANELFDTSLESIWCLVGSSVSFGEGRYELTRTLATRAAKAFDSRNVPLGSAHATMWLGSVDVEEGRYGEAYARFRLNLDVALDYGERNMLAHLLEGFAGLASARGQHQRALRLGGAADALREIQGAPLHLPTRDVVDRWLTLSREALGAEAATVARTAGRKLPLERALEEAKLEVVSASSGSEMSRSVEDLVDGDHGRHELTSWPTAGMPEIF